MIIRPSERLLQFLPMATAHTRVRTPSGRSSSIDSTGDERLACGPNICHHSHLHFLAPPFKIPRNPRIASPAEAADVPSIGKGDLNDLRQQIANVTKPSDSKTGKGCRPTHTHTKAGEPRALRFTREISTPPQSTPTMNAIEHGSAY